MKLYTKRGDEGSTDLFGGQRVSKDHIRVEAYGGVDELNSVVGHAAAACNNSELCSTLQHIQSRLFEIGADLATPRKGDDEEDNSVVPRIKAEQVEEMEQTIDRISEGLPEMKHFVLPGGCELASRLHVARTVCRRSERMIVRLDQEEPVGDQIAVYLNRLSDLLFAMARKANLEAGVKDIEWLSPKRRDS